MRVIPAALWFVIAISVGFVLEGRLGAQCNKCCGYAIANWGTRTSSACQGSLCTWINCANACNQCPGGFTCSGTYALYVDSCTNIGYIWCPCDMVNSGCPGNCGAAGT